MEIHYGDSPGNRRNGDLPEYSPALFHMNRFRRADIYACLTVNAHILINFGFFVFHCYCRRRAFINARFTTCAFICINNCDQKFHSPSIASEGQISIHVSQSTHISLSIFAFSFSIAIADAGHSFTHVSHPEHLLMSTIATNAFTSFYMFKQKIKNRFRFYHSDKKQLTRIPKNIFYLKKIRAPETIP